MRDLGNQGAGFSDIVCVNARGLNFRLNQSYLTPNMSFQFRISIHNGIELFGMRCQLSQPVLALLYVWACQFLFLFQKGQNK